MHKNPIQLSVPAKDLRDLGEKLQQSIDLTGARLHQVKNPRLRLRAKHALDRANYMFGVMAQTVQTVDRVKTFLLNGFGLDVDQLLSMAGDHEQSVRASTYSAMLLMNEGIDRVLNELSSLNSAMDIEVQHDEKKMQP
jgi:hypothetical protein